MESFAVRFLKSSFIYWIAAALFSLIYFVGFDYSKFSSSTGPIITRFVESASFKNLRLGIDLQGGTRLILKLEDEKVIDGKLVDAGRNIERILSSNEISLSTKSLNNGILSLIFEKDNDADKALSIIKKELKRFTITQDNLTIAISFSSSEKISILEGATDKAIDILRNRLDSLDVRGLSVTKQGSSKIVVTLPGKEDISDIKETIARAAKLEFKLVYESAHSEEMLLDKYDGVLPSDKMIITDQKGHKAYLVSIFADVAGARVTNARQTHDQYSRPEVSFDLDAEGGKDFCEVTRENIGMQLAVIIDNKVISAPNIQSEIGRERNGRITGVSSTEGIKLAKLLRSGSLDSGLKIESEIRVGASLGTDSIVKGLTSCLLALFLLLIFSIIYYKTSGLLACLALVYNILILLLMLAFLNTTLTLPGIAAIVLTVGMAIDASVLIFERIKEELSSGLISYHAAVEEGFNGAISIILDSNITTFIAGLVLFFYGGASVKGFAVSLMVGIISTLITGVFFLRSAFDFCKNVLKLDKISI